MADWNFAIVHRLNSALGWIELGNFAEAREELNGLPADYAGKPEVLEIHWIVDAACEDWDKALETARQLLKVAPEHPEAWLHQAYALRRATNGGIEAAWQALESAEDKFPQEPTIPYNLACYACQMGRLEQARILLRKAINRGNSKEIKELALRDPDLQALWKEITELN